MLRFDIYVKIPLTHYIFFNKILCLAVFICQCYRELAVDLVALHFIPLIVMFFDTALFSFCSKNGRLLQFLSLLPFGSY